MKKLLSLSLIFSLILALITPGLSLAHDLNQDELDEYLEYIEMTEEELESYLQERWGASLEYFYDVEELDLFLGPLLTEEDLHWLLEDFEITYEEFEQLVADAGLTMDYFIFFDDVYYFLLDTIEMPLFPDDYFDLRGYMSEFSLSEKEATLLLMHFFEVRENNPNLSADLNALKDRGLSFRDGEFESIRELNAQEIAELFAIGEKAIELLDLHPEFYLDAAGKDKKAIDYTTLMSGEAIKGYDLLIELYDAEGTFLADFYITAEMFNSHFVKNILDDVDQIGKDVEEKINETDKKIPNRLCIW